MIKIRYPRLAKFRKKNQKLMLASKIVAIWYITFISIVYLTSNTGAYFTAQDQESFEIQAGYWDYSKLQFIKKGNDNLNEFIFPTNEFEISTIIKNVGETDMFRDGTYEVYYVENGEPSVNGFKVDEGNISKIQAGQELVLTQKVTSEGFYMFKAFEDTGQNKEKVIWSEKIKVKYKTSNSPDKGVKSEGENDTSEKQVTPKEDSIVNEPKVENSLEETINVPGVELENKEPNNNNQNNTVSVNNNATTAIEEEQKQNESQNN
jgi:YqxM protein